MKCYIFTNIISNVYHSILCRNPHNVSAEWMLYTSYGLRMNSIGFHILSASTKNRRRVDEWRGKSTIWEKRIKYISVMVVGTACFMSARWMYWLTGWSGITMRMKIPLAGYFYKIMDIFYTTDCLVTINSRSYYCYRVFKSIFI